jgi:hypothetical protein
VYSGVVSCFILSPILLLSFYNKKALHHISKHCGLLASQTGMSEKRVPIPKQMAVSGLLIITNAFSAFHGLCCSRPN